MRPETDTPRCFETETGKAISYWGATDCGLTATSGTPSAATENHAATDTAALAAVTAVADRIEG